MSAQIDISVFQYLKRNSEKRGRERERREREEREREERREKREERREKRDECDARLRSWQQPWVSSGARGGGKGFGNE